MAIELHLLRYKYCEMNAINTLMDTKSASQQQLTLIYQLRKQYGASLISLMDKQIPNKLPKLMLMATTVLVILTDYCLTFHTICLQT